MKRPAAIQQDETSALESTLPHVGAGPPDLERTPAASGERILPSDAPLTEWVVDPEVLETQRADRIEEQEVMAPAIETVKLKDIVPPIRFESGVADISPTSVEKLRKTLDDMQHLANVRLHLVGHADDQPLSRSLAAQFGDNEGLSKERAGEVAEHLQRALALPPESIAYEWAGDARPIAPNTSAEGRAKNRRVEVEVWYDGRRPEVRPAGSRRPRRDPALQGLPHRARLQAQLPGGEQRARPGQEPDPAARVPERVDRASPRLTSARSSRPSRTSATSRT